MNKYDSYINKILMESDIDSEYLELAKNPEKNNAELQRMVDETARASGFATTALHQTNSDQFTQFDISKARSVGRSRIGFFFTDNPDVEYGRNRMDVYLDVHNPLEFDTFNDFAVWADLNETDFGDTASLRKLLLDEGFYDGIEIRGKTDGFDQTITVAFDPSQIKSADPVTKDDQGQVIPLSKRFDISTEDIRY